ncbi:MAG: STM4013/SEN3800 family hydrolase [Armatimonadota bacterium]
MISMRQLVGTHDLLFVTLDTLRYDVAEYALRQGKTPRLAAYLPGGVWEARHTPGNFTYAAHQAFFAGFLPTPTTPGKHPRLFAAHFPGSETTCDETFVFDEPDIVHALAHQDYHTACIGGVGFFNKLSTLGSVFPDLFQESHWSVEMGVTGPCSTEHQVRCALEIIERLPGTRRLFLFMNISALHQPNCIFAEGATDDSPATQAAALAYVDRHLPAVIEALRQRAPVAGILCSDHGTAYGEDGYHGHRLGHDVVWTVPYAEFVLPQARGRHDRG